MRGGASLRARVYYSVGGGFVVDEGRGGGQQPDSGRTRAPCRIRSRAPPSCWRIAEKTGFAMSRVMLENEKAWRPEAETRAALLRIWSVMQDCVRRGCETDGILPGGLKVKRRAADLYRSLIGNPEAGLRDPLTAIDWVNLYALAVNEENAAGGRVVTAPTNGAAGIIPAVLHYYRASSRVRATTASSASC